MGKRLNQLKHVDHSSLYANTYIGVCSDSGELKNTTLSDLKKYMLGENYTVDLNSLIQRVAALEEEMNNTLLYTAIPSEPEPDDDEGGLAG
jgi:hypothetical protein